MKKKRKRGETVKSIENIRIKGGDRIRVKLNEKGVDKRKRGGKKKQFVEI